MISVVLPTYNRENTIMRAVQSVLDQAFSDLELIIVDDGSTDSTEEIIRSIDDPRIRYIKLDNNAGACVARNTGIDNAKGDYIAFQDSDDQWHLDKLERQIEIMRKTGADVSFHKMSTQRLNKEEVVVTPRLSGSKYMSHEEMSSSFLISTQNIMAKREVLSEIRFDPKVRKAQDYDWAVRASINHSFYFIDLILTDRFIQKDSLSEQGYRVILENRQYLLNKYKEECAQNSRFEVFHLKAIARYKTLLGENAIEEFKRIFSIRHKVGDLIRILLCRLHLMGLMYRIKGYKKNG